MRKIFILLLIAVVFISFAACRKGTDSNNSNNDTNVNGDIIDQNDNNDKENDDNENDSNEKTNENETNENDINVNENNNGDSNGNGNNSDPQIAVYNDIAITSGFSEGLAFIINRSDQKTLKCINKKGEPVFELEGYTYETPFYNGYAYVTDRKNIYICDVKGNLISPERFDGEVFVHDIRGNNPLIDGYIIVSKTISDFQGSTNLMAVFDSDFNEVLPYSEELYNNYKNVSGMQYTWYYNGHVIYSDRRFLNLRNGQLETDFSTMQLVNESDFWKFLNNHIGDALIYNGKFRDETNIDLSQYAETMQTDTYFEDNCALLPFISDNKCYFTIIEHTGNFRFDPKLILEVPANSRVKYSYKRSGDLIVFTALQDTDTYMVTYDLSGNEIASLTLNESSISDHNSITISDGVISLRDGRSNWRFYDANLKPLFEMLEVN